MRIVIGSDEAGFELKGKVKQYLESKGNKLVDVGCHSTDPVLYPDIADEACKRIVDGTCERGVLICGTGIGMAITANKVPGIRAAVGHDIYSVERCVMSNNCQVVTFGARIVAYEYVTQLLDKWLECEFVDGHSTPKVEEINKIEQGYRKA
jgi:ribose 5-phosphate isomerase B